LKNSFNIGDIVIMQHADNFPEYDGYPGIIIKDIRSSSGLDLNTMEYHVDDRYEVKILKGADYFSNGSLCVGALPHQIRHPRENEDTRKHEKLLEKLAQ
jgi:hypothetical protein